MSEVKIGQVVKVRLSNHEGSLGPWTFAVVMELGREHPIHGRQVSCLLDPKGPREQGNSDRVTRYIGASRFDCSPAVAVELTVEVHARLASAFTSLTTQSQAGAAQVTKQYQAPDIQTVCLRQTKGGLFNKLSGKQLQAILEHPDVLAAVKDNLAGAEHSVIDDLRRMLSACQSELDAERHRKEELTGKLVSLTRRLDASVESYNRLIAEKKKQPVLTEDQLLYLAGEKRGFVLWNPASQIPPRVKYESLTEAKNVQEIMAKRCPGEVFHIMPIGLGLKIVKPVAAIRVVC